MEKTEVYRVRKGTLIGKNIHIHIDFGLIFEEDGNYLLDVYVPESMDLEAFSEGPNAHIDNKFNASFVTEDKNELKINELSVFEVACESSRISLNCYGNIMHKDISFLNDETSNVDNARVISLELEGLKMEFSDLTSQVKHRLSYGHKSKGFSVDHTGTELRINNTCYTQIFRKAIKDDNIVVEFRSSDINKLLYNEFIKFKKDYISFLSFFNGAEVKIRKEYLGDLILIGSGDLHSSIVITHCFRKIRNESYNKYIPLGYRFQNRNPNILNLAMTNCFTKFRDWNTKIDLSSIIFYLNGAEKIKRIEEKFFILIIAFERLTTLYAEGSGLLDLHLPKKENFIPIRDELFKVLEIHKIEFGANYEKARSIIANLHEVKRISTKDKMYSILHDTQITVDDNLRELINIVRNKAIHKGDIGEGLKGIKNLCLLNELLYEIICRLIGYDGPKISDVLLESENLGALLS